MTDAPERIWIDAAGGHWSPKAGGTQGVEYIRADAADAALAKAEADALRRAAAEIKRWWDDDNARNEPEALILALIPKEKNE